MSNGPKEIGHLVDNKHWDRKKILEWSYLLNSNIGKAAIERLGEPKADIAIVNKGRDEGVIFVADSPWFGESKRRNEISDKSLAGLRRKVEEAFRDQILAHAKVIWEDWMEIEIKSHRDEDRDEFEEGDGRSASVDVSYKILKRGKFPDGRDMVMDGRNLYPFPEAKAAGEKDPRYKGDGFRAWHDVYGQHTRSQFAYIPATPENLAAFKALFGKLGEVNARLMAILSQQSIKKTISLLANDTLRLEKK